MKTSKQLAKKIRKYMKDNRCSIRGLAEKLEVSAGCIQGVLKGNGAQINDGLAVRLGSLSGIKVSVVVISGK